MLSQLSSFVAVLDEPGVSYERASMAALCAGEGLLRVSGEATETIQTHLSFKASSVLYRYSPTGVTDIIGAISAFTDSLQIAATMTRPVAPLHSSGRPHSKEVCAYFYVIYCSNDSQQLECLISALRELEGDEFAYPAILLRPQDDFPALQDVEPSFELPAILVPPEIAHVEDEVSTSAPLVRHRELPVVWVQLFDVEVRISFNSA
jgi:nuclear cap-binding protein subunit 1